MTISAPIVSPRPHLEALFNRIDPKRGRVIFAIDATASRQPTWDQAAHLQAKMFETVADMGGLDQCSEIKLALLRRLAACTVQAELLEAKVVAGEPVNVSELCTLASTALRLSARVGIERVSKDVTPSLADYLAENYPPDEADEAANHEGEDQ